MNQRNNVWVVPSDYSDRFPDGDYTVGRGGDPRSAAERAADKTAEATAAKAPKPAKPRAAKKKLRPAAE